MSAPTSTQILANVEAVRNRLARACERANRDPAAVTLIAVSKTQSPEAVGLVIEAGVRDFGENRVQEALRKRDALPDDVRWHFIGHLQSNKVKTAVGRFVTMHSIDSIRLLAAVDEATIRRQSIMLEVNVASEPTKYGVDPGSVGALVKAAESYANVVLEGLMTVAPRSADPEGVRPVFHRLRRLAEEYGLGQLSMGMTDDFEVAIEEGATHIRVGRAIFGERTI